MAQRLKRSTLWGGRIYHPGDETDLPDEAVKDIKTKGLFEGQQTLRGIELPSATNDQWNKSSPYVDERGNPVGFDEEEVRKLAEKQGLLTSAKAPRGSGNAPLTDEQKKELDDQQEVDEAQRKATAKAQASGGKEAS